MIIDIAKFGDILISRPAGREAALIIMSSFRPANDFEPIELDFSKVKVVTSPWLNEVLTSLRDTYGERGRCLRSTNSTLIESLKFVSSR